MCFQVATPIKDLLRTSQKNVKQRSDIQDCWMLMSVKDLRRRRNQVNIKCLFRTTWFGVKILLVFVCGSSRVILEFEAFFTKKPTTTTDGRTLGASITRCIKMKNKTVNFSAENSIEISLKNTKISYHVRTLSQ